jgi:hypothetical protein
MIDYWAIGLMLLSVIVIILYLFFESIDVENYDNPMR